MNSFISKKPPRERRYHYGVGIREDGAVTALCFARPHPIDLRRASWTNRQEAVTCPKCLAALAARYAP